MTVEFQLMMMELATIIFLHMMEDIVIIVMILILEFPDVEVNVIFL